MFHSLPNLFRKICLFIGPFVWIAVGGEACYALDRCQTLFSPHQPEAPRSGFAEVKTRAEDVYPVFPSLAFERSHPPKEGRPGVRTYSNITGGAQLLIATPEVAHQVGPERTEFHFELNNAHTMKLDTAISPSYRDLVTSPWGNIDPKRVFSFPKEILVVAIVYYPGIAAEKVPLLTIWQPTRRVQIPLRDIFNVDPKMASHLSELQIRLTELNGTTGPLELSLIYDEQSQIFIRIPDSANDTLLLENQSLSPLGDSSKTSKVSRSRNMIPSFANWQEINSPPLGLWFAIENSDYRVSSSLANLVIYRGDRVILHTMLPKYFTSGYFQPIQGMTLDSSLNMLFRLRPTTNFQGSPHLLLTLTKNQERMSLQILDLEYLAAHLLIQDGYLSLNDELAVRQAIASRQQMTSPSQHQVVSATMVPNSKKTIQLILKIQVEQANNISKLVTYEVKLAPHRPSVPTSMRALYFPGDYSRSPQLRPDVLREAVYLHNIVPSYQAVSFN